MLKVPQCHYHDKQEKSGSNGAYDTSRERCFNVFLR
jgi:hypothetical protein